MKRSAAVLLASLLSAPSAAAQSVPEIVDRMLAAIERRTQDIERYSVVHHVMGAQTATRYERSVVRGRTVFQRSGSSGGFEIRMGDRRVDDISEYLDALIEHGRYAGTEGTGEGRAYRLVVDDVQAAGVGEVVGPDGTRLVVESAALSVEAERYVPLLLELEGDAHTDGDTHEVTTTIEFLDYREVEGLLIPYRTVLTTDGLEEAVDAAALAQLDDLMARLAEMEPERRAMIEEMMGPEIERMRRALTEQGPITIELTVIDVRVRRGPGR